MFLIIVSIKWGWQRQHPCHQYNTVITKAVTNGIGNWKDAGGMNHEATFTLGPIFY
jgi:hypothetical protein